MEDYYLEFEKPIKEIDSKMWQKASKRIQTTRLFSFNTGKGEVRSDCACASGSKGQVPQIDSKSTNNTPSVRVAGDNVVSACFRKLKQK